MTMYRSAGGLAVQGTAQRPTAARIDALLPLAPSPARPSWMATRFPVFPEEYERLKREATTAFPIAAAPGGATEDVDLPDVGGPPPGLEVPEGETVAGAPAIRASFRGPPQTAYRPADCTIAAGPGDVLVAVNTDVLGFARDGTFRFRWPNASNLFGSVLPEGAGLFDPRVAYDHYAGRWLIVAVARRESVAGSWLMVGASEGGDPAGGWWAWALDAALDGTTMSANWADYPAVGFDTQCIYISTNQFRFNGAFQYSKLRVLNKAELYAGGTASDRTIRWYDLWDLQDPDGVAAFTIQPAVHFRGMGGDPPAYFVDSLWGAGSSLTLWTLQDPLAFWRGGASTLISTAIPCFPYDLPPDAIQEPGGLNRLETNDNRLLNAIYQYAPGGGRRLWTCHHTRYTWPGDSEARSAIQWYEVDISSGAIRQQNRFGAPSRYYFYPAIQTDRGGNAYLVFGRSSADEYAQLRQTGRRSGDDLGDLQSSVSIKDGESAYTQPRWGDYFGIARDGGEPTAIWMFGQYADVGSNWATWIASSSF